MDLSKLRNRNGRQGIYAIYGFMKINGAERMHMVHYKKLWWLFRETDTVIFIFCWIPRNFLSFEEKLRREEEEFAALHSLEFIFWMCSLVLEFAWAPSHCTLAEFIPDWITTLSGAIFRVMSKLLAWWYSG